MIPVRTKKGKLFGKLDSQRNYLHIKDGKNVRLIKIPPDGLQLLYAPSDNQPEPIFVEGRTAGIQP